MRNVVSGTPSVALVLVQPRLGSFPVYRPVSLWLPCFPFISADLLSLAVSRTPDSWPWLYSLHYLSVFFPLVSVS